MPATAQLQEKKDRTAKPLQLDAGTASQVRRGFGLDPAQLEIGESEAVRAMGARAVAKGNVIQFAPGEFSPETSEGRMVLGHELAHLRSQAKGEVPMTGGFLEQPSYEAAADRAGEAFASGSLAAPGPVNALSGSAAQAAPAQGFLFNIGKKRRSKKDKQASLAHWKNLLAAEAEAKKARTKGTPEYGRAQMTQAMKDGGDAPMKTMDMLYRESMTPTLSESLTITQGKDDKERLRHAGVSAFRGSSDYNTAKTMLLQSTPSSTLDFSEVEDTDLTTKRDDNAPSGESSGVSVSEEQATPLLLNLLRQFQGNLAKDTNAQAIYGQFSDALKQHDLFQKDEIRGRLMSNDALLRVINPHITDQLLGVERNTPKYDKYVALSKLLQKSANQYSMNGNMGTLENPNLLHEMFDSLGQQLSGYTNSGPTEPVFEEPELEYEMLPMPTEEETPTTEAPKGNGIKPLPIPIVTANPELEAPQEETPAPVEPEQKPGEMDPYEMLVKMGYTAFASMNRDTPSPLPKKKKGNWFTNLFRSKSSKK